MTPPAPALANLPDAVLVFDRDLRCVDLNPAFERLAATKAASLLGRRPPELERLGFLEALGRRLTMALSGETLIAPDQSFRSPNTGRLLWLSVRYSPLRDTSDTVTGALVMVADVTRRKEIEAALASSEEGYRLLFEGNPHPVWVCDQESRAFLAVNEAALRHYGYSREEFLALSLTDITAPGERDTPTPRVDSTPTLEVVRHRRKDGTWIDVELASSPLVFHGRPARLVLGFDVTERRVAEEKIRLSEERYRQLVELCPDGIFLHAQETFTFANQAGVRLLGAQSLEEIVGRRVLDRVHPEFHSLVRSQFDLLLTRGGQIAPSQQRFLRLDGSPIEVEVLATSLWIDNTRAVQMIVRDVTERQRLESELRRSHANFLRVFQSSPVAMGICRRPEGRFLDVNHALLAMSGYTRDEVVNRTPSELRLWRETGPRGGFLERLENQGAVRNLEATLRLKNGSTRQMLLSGESLELAEDPCLLLTAVDVTDRALLERQLREAHIMEAMVQLAGGLAHSFNNILSVIQANASLLQVRERISPRGLESLELLLKSANRGAGLIKQILTLSRRRPLQLGFVDLADLLHRLLPNIRQTLGGTISLDLQAAPNLPILRADRELLEQVVINLVTNAREAMPEGGHLTLSTQLLQIEEPPASSPAAARPGPYLRLTVQDTGAGIDPTVLPRIFEPFFTTRHQAKTLGLGLAIVHGVVQQHNGWVEVESRVGHGTAMAVYLPPAPPAEPSRPASPASSPP